MKLLLLSMVILGTVAAKVAVGGDALYAPVDTATCYQLGVRSGAYATAIVLDIPCKPPLCNPSDGDLRKPARCMGDASYNEGISDGTRATNAMAGSPLRDK